MHLAWETRRNGSGPADHHWGVTVDLKPERDVLGGSSLAGICKMDWKGQE